MKLSEWEKRFKELRLEHGDIEVELPSGSLMRDAKVITRVADRFEEPRPNISGRSKKERTNE